MENLDEVHFLRWVVVNAGYNFFRGSEKIIDEVINYVVIARNIEYVL